MSAEKMKLPRAKTPESVGVSSAVVADFLHEAAEAGLEFHSFMVLRHGKVAVEFFRPPYSPDKPHQMYSVSKSMTSTAIGFAIEEGLLSLDDKVKDFFPDYTEKLQDEKLEALTVRHLLNMTSGKDVGFISDKGADWIEGFFAAPWYASPGEEFKYISENIFMLCAILTRKTNMSVRDFLKPRLFEPLDIDYPFWETDPNGIEAGGWGLYLTTEDLAKFTLCYQQKGVFNGKQIIPKSWAEQAVIAQSEDSIVKNGGDSNSGYGYCFWRNGEGRGSYRADGMFSQFGMVFEEHDAVFVCTAAIPSEDTSRGLIWNYFPAAFDACDQENPPKPVENFQNLLSSYAFPDPNISAHSFREVMIDGRLIKFRKKIILNLIGFPMSVLPLAVVYMAADKAGNIDNVRLHFESNEVTMDWTEGDEYNLATCGMDGHYRYGQIRLGGIDYKICAHAEWIDNDNLVLHIRPIETIGKRILRFRFHNSNRVEMHPSSTPEIQAIADNLVDFVTNFLNAPRFRNLIRVVMTKVLPLVVEPVHHGRLTKE